MVAFVVPVSDIAPDPEDLRTYVRQHLRGSRTPDRVVFRRELPTTPTGKVLRRQLADELTKPTGYRSQGGQPCQDGNPAAKPGV